MEKQTKNIITREWIEKELRFYNTADIRSALALCGSLSLFFVPLTVGLVYGLCVWLENVWLKVLLSVLVGGITSAPIWLNLLPLRDSLAERKLLFDGAFEIEVGKLLYKSEKMVQRHTEYFLHFEEFDEISVGSTTYMLAEKGDEFYIVHYQAKKLIKLLYSAKIYEYIDK